MDYVLDDVEEIFTIGIGEVDEYVVVLMKLEKYVQKLWKMMMMDIYNSTRRYLVSLEKALPDGVDPLHPSQPLGSPFPCHSLVLFDGPHSPLGQHLVARANLVLIWIYFI